MSILVVFSGGFRQFLPVKTVYLVSGAGFNRGRGIGRNYQILWEELERANPFVWKHLVAIGVSIAILLLLYWLLVAEDMNAWLTVN